MLVAVGQGVSGNSARVDALETVVGKIAEKVGSATGALDFSDETLLTEIAAGSSLNTGKIAALAAANNGIKNAADLTSIVGKQQKFRRFKRRRFLVLLRLLESQNGNDVTFGIYVNEDFLPVLSTLM